MPKFISAKEFDATQPLGMNHFGKPKFHELRLASGLRIEHVLSRFGVPKS